MKRIVVTAGVVVLSSAVLAAVAYAATQKDFGGPIQGGGTMSFGALGSNGKYTKVGSIYINRIPLKCNEGTTLGNLSTSSTFYGVNVSSRRKFSYTMNFGGGQTVKLSGQFNAKGNKATGTVNASGLNFTSLTNCTTKGSRKWRAETY